MDKWRDWYTNHTSSDELADEQDYISFNEAVDEAEFSEIDCPRCKKSKLKIISYATSPDDYENGLVCPLCRYEERE